MAPLPSRISACSAVRDFYAIVNPPQAAIIAVGAIEPRPVVREGEIVVGNIMNLSLSADHRILYGAPRG